jgi:hypothetical protein
VNLTFTPTCGGINGSRLLRAQLRLDLRESPLKRKLVKHGA